MSKNFNLLYFTNNNIIHLIIIKLKLNIISIILTDCIILFLLQSGIMITGGEAGILNVWVPSNTNDEKNTNKCSFKEMPKVSLKNRTSKPY